MKIGTLLEMYIVFRHPGNVSKDGALGKFNSDDYKGEKTVTQINNSDDLLLCENRAAVVSYLPPWFDFKIYKLFIIKYKRNDTISNS